MEIFCGAITHAMAGLWGDGGAVKARKKESNEGIKEK